MAFIELLSRRLHHDLPILGNSLPVPEAIEILHRQPGQIQTGVFRLTGREPLGKAVHPKPIYMFRVRFARLSRLPSRKVYASWVEKTNLLLVVVKQGPKSSCYDDTQCSLSDPPLLQFGFQKTADPLAATPSSSSPEADVCLGAVPRKRKNVVQCLRDDYLTVCSSFFCL